MTFSSKSAMFYAIHTYPSFLLCRQRASPFILSIASVILKRTTEPSRKNRSQTLISSFTCSTDENTVTNQCRVIRDSSMSCSLTTPARPGKNEDTRDCSTRWSACTPERTHQQWWIVRGKQSGPAEYDGPSKLINGHSTLAIIPVAFLISVV